MHPILEADWRYLNGLRDELLSSLCERLNGEALRLARDASVTQHEKFLALHGHWGGNPDHGYRMIQRGTNFGVEHFFDKTIFPLLRF